MKQQKPLKRVYFRWEVLIPLVVLFFVALHDWKTNTIINAIVDGDSMSPSFHNGEYVKVTTVYPRLIRNDVLLVKTEEGLIIKRLLFLPGDKFWMVKYSVDWTYTPDELAEELLKLDMFEQRHIELKEDEIWVQGDNSSNSYDSRNFGPIKTSDIVGVVVPWRENVAPEESIPMLEQIKKLRSKGIPLTKERIYKYDEL